MPAQRSDSFDAFYREHAPAVFDLALRHGGDHTIAIDCVDAVFAALASRWHQTSDPVRFCRRAAVLFVCGSRRHGYRPRRCRPNAGTSNGSSAGAGASTPASAILG